jgi:hypothetical protein
MHRRPVPLATIALALVLLACTPPATTAPTATPAPPTPTTAPTPTEVEPPATTAPQWPTYRNEAHGFSIGHPPEFSTPPAGSAETFGTLGDQITFSVNAADPEECRGDCPVIETTSTESVAGLTATKYTGYMGAVGGNVPKQYVSYVFTRDELYYTFTLYAVPLTFTTDDTSIQPLQPEDVALFEQMVATFQFTS